MPIGRLSIRSRPGNHLHHLYRNNGDVWWVYYTLNWEGRTRRIRRSLGTKRVDEAVRLRDELFARIDAEGESIPERRTRVPVDRCMPQPCRTAHETVIRHCPPPPRAIWFARRPADRVSTPMARYSERSAGAVGFACRQVIARVTDAPTAGT
jgi:hypothetical protein